MLLFFGRGIGRLMAQAGRKQRILLRAAGASVLALGTIAVVGGAFRGFSPSANVSPVVTEELALETTDEDSRVLSLVNLEPAERAETLEAIASERGSLEQARARYLLAADLIRQGRGGSALPHLEGLEDDYPVLAPAILAQRAQAQTATGDAEAAMATWQRLLDEFPESPMTVEAKEALGAENEALLQEAIARFPAHPRTLQIVLNKLVENPNQPELLLLLARHGVDLPDVTGVLDRLVAEYADQLTPEDWEAIAFAYWENLRYDDAGNAYANATPTAVNLYRAGRGAHIGDRRDDALTYYQQAIQEFPEAPETATAMLRMADLARPPESGLLYLDQVIQRFPDRAGEALLQKSELLDQLSSPDAASQARQTLLTEYSDSAAAAELRWGLAERSVEQGELAAAQTWAAEVIEQNPTSEEAPEAAYWLGKWALDQGNEAAAQARFEAVLQRYPESYYAWRSATMLGWDVGDFTTVRYQQPDVQPLGHRITPPVGSDALIELYKLGQDRDAYAHWQTEFTNAKEPSVSEQFTDGLMRLGVNDNLDGIYMISTLRRRTDPTEQAEYQSLRQQTAYWEALYPFPYMDVVESWAAERQLNPMLVIALMRQESRFEPKIRSVVGAVGLMQVMPSTGEWIAGQIDLTDYNLEDPDDNVKLGTWYLDYTHETYADHSMLAIASYNAGPGNVDDWMNRFGLDDPDRFVEQIPFPETKGYVEAVFENYWNYLRLYNPAIAQQMERLNN
ncbi:transglycosylase SLT domain-containing protein [Vacuolonema iberomarrocanum]|uniref:lytic transglycosylase domain-containing protein n=1 Tax=Vacuolonema iberomarrocanum TaxID=3454632 RepID=UPI003F6DD7E7